MSEATGLLDDVMSADDGLVALVDEARGADLALRTLLADDARDTDEIPGFGDQADALIAMVDRVCATRAFGMAGLVAKARLAEHLARHEGEQGARLALSVARDLIALSVSVPT